MRLDSSVMEPSPWPRRVAVVWAALVLALCVRSAIYPRIHSLYPVYAQAGASWLAERDCYTSDADQYRYSPLVSCFFAPCSMLPDWLGGVLWRLLSIGLCAIAFHYYIQCAWPGPTVDPRTRAALWFLLLPLSVESMNNGQANVIVLAGLLGGAAAVSHQRWNLAAACLACAFFFKIYPLALGLLLAAAFPRKLGVPLVMAVAIGLAVPFFHLNPSYVSDQYASWLSFVAGDNRLDWKMGDGYRDAHLLVRFFFGAVSLPVARAIQLAPAAALGLLAWRGGRLRRPNKDLVHDLFCLGCCWMVLFGPSTESATYILLAPVLSFALVEAWRRQNSFVSQALLGLVLAGFVTSFVHRQLLGPGLPLYILQPLGALALFVERCCRAFPRATILSDWAPLPAECAPAQQAGPT